MTAPVPDPVFVLRQESETFHSLLFSSNSCSKSLLSGSENGKIVSWDLLSGRSNPSSTIHIGTSPCLSIHQTDEGIITQDKEGNVKFWSTKDTSCLATIKLDYFGFCKLDSNKSSRILVCPKQNSALQIFSTTTREEISVLDVGPGDDRKLGDVMACTTSNKGELTYVIAAYECGDLLSWDIESRSLVSRSNLTGNDCPMSLDYDRGRGVVVSNSDRIVVFRTSDAMAISKRHEMRMHSEGASCVKLRPDGRVFAVGCWDGKVRVFETKTCRRLVVLCYHEVAILDLTFSNDDKDKCLIAVAGKDGKISLWDVCN